MGALSFRCTCGTVTGHLTETGKGHGILLTCHCNSCRAAEVALNQPDPGRDGVVLYQTTPDRVKFTTGQDQLAVMRLGPGSRTFRWHAACCGAPLFNTGPRPGFPFASLHVSRVDAPETLGPVRARAFVAQAGGAARHKNLGRFIYSLLQTGLTSRLSGRWKDTPFFDVGTGRTIPPLRTLTAEERAALPLRG